MYMYTHVYVLKYMYTHACVDMYVCACTSHMYTCVYLRMEKSVMSIWKKGLMGVITLKCVCMCMYKK